MADGRVGVKQNAGADREIDNDAFGKGGTTVYRQRVSPGPVTAATVNATVSGDTTVKAAPSTSGNAYIVRWFQLHMHPSDSSSTVTVTLKVGATTIFVDVFEPSQQITHRTFQVGPADGAITVNLSGALSHGVRVNVEFEEITP